MSTNRSGGGIARGAYAGSGTNASPGPAAHATIPVRRAASQRDVMDFARKVQDLVHQRGVNALIEVSFGRRYARIYKIWGSQHVCWGWVDMTDGEIKRGGWKAPDTRVKASHGNIFAPDVLKYIEWTGPRYL